MQQPAFNQQNLKSIQRCKSAARLLAFTGGLLGMTAWVGWLTNTPSLTYILPAFPPMLPITALTMISSALSLALQIPEKTSPLRYSTAKLLATLIVIFGILFSMEYVFGIDFGFNGLLLGPEMARSTYTGVAYRGRPSPEASVGFVFLGLALLFLGSETSKGKSPVQAFALGAGLVAWLGFTGFFFQKTWLYSILAPGRLVGATLHTILGFLSIIAGIFLARPTQGIMTLLISRGSGGMVARRILLAILSIPFFVRLFLEIGKRIWSPFDPPLQYAWTTISMTSILAFSSWLIARRLEDTDVRRSLLERQQRLLAHTSSALIETTDSARLPAMITDFLVPEMADYCCVYEAAPKNHFKISARGVLDSPNREAQKKTFFRLHELPEPISGFQEAARTGKPLLVSQVTEEILRPLARSDQHLERLRFFLRSYLLAPVKVRSGTLYVILLVSGESGRSYDISDFFLLEELARRISLAIDNAQLLQDSLRATRLREDILSFVSHDLKNPLSAILLNVSLLNLIPLESTRIREKLQKVSSNIQHAAEQMRHLIQQLLDFAKIQAGQFSLRSVELGVDELLSSTRESFIVLAENRRIKLDLEIAPDAPKTIHGDWDELLRVLSNLLGNAIKFTPPGGKVTVGARSRGHRVLLYVSDTGPGIKPDELPRVFDQFWQAKGVSRMGSGLGLSIAKGIVEAHGGSIWAESRPGKGSTFFFELPARAHGVKAA